MARIVIRKKPHRNDAFPDVYHVDVEVPMKGREGEFEIVATSPDFDRYTQCRSWISGIKRVAKFTKVTDETGE